MNGLGYLAFVAAALLVYVYIGRLVILNPKSPGVLPFAVLAGFVVDPAWFAWLGVVLRRPAAQPPLIAEITSTREPGASGVSSAARSRST